MASKLPPYMVPTYFTQLESFPHTPNGKVSVKALRELEINTGEIREFERPETKTENEVFVILAEQLGTYEFGTGDDLFTLGLTSLSMISLVTQLYKRFGVSVPVSALLRNRTVRDISSLMDTLTAERSENSAKADQRVYYPMTPNQMGIYFDCMQHPEGIGYHLPNVIRFGKNVSPEKLRKAVIKAIEHHPYLKVTFGNENGKPVQVRNDSRAFEDTIEIKHTDSFTDEMAESLAAVPFEINGGLLFRFSIFVTAEETVLFSMFHHLIADGTSLNIIFDDITAAYDGRELSQESIDGYGYALREQEAEGGADYTADLEYYKQQFAIAFVFAAMAVIRRREKPEPAAFLLPKENTDDKFEASLLPDVSRAAEVSQNAGIWIDERADAFQNKAALAVEEMLVGIITANNGKECIIDLCIINEETEIVLNIKDNGVTWNPTVLDRELRYEFDNISVLNSISSLIEFDKVLGMNSTRIHLSK